MPLKLLMQKKLLGKLLLIGISSILSVTICLLIIYFGFPQFYYDRFIYGKSLQYGFWPAGKNLTVQDYGQRGEDVQYIVTLSEKSPDVSGMTTSQEDTYNIALLGDSFVWGNGLTLDQTIKQTLLDKLNQKITNKQVNVYSYAMGGDSLLDHLAKLKILEENNQQINLYIVEVVYNDLLIRPDIPYNNPIYTEVIHRCSQKYPSTTVSKHPAWDMLVRKDANELGDQALYASYQNPINICIFSESLKELEAAAKGKILFFLTNYSQKRDGIWEQIVSYFTTNNINYIEATEGQKISKYSHCFDNEETIKQCFWVTHYDIHPSALANEMFAELFIQNMHKD